MALNWTLITSACSRTKCPLHVHFAADARRYVYAKKIMKLYVIVFTLLFHAAPVSASDLTDEKRRAIDAFLKAVDMDISAPASLVPESVDAAIVELRNSGLRIDESMLQKVKIEATRIVTEEYDLEKAFEDTFYILIGDHFTKSELEDVTSFMKSTAWKKFEGMGDVVGSNFKQTFKNRTVEMRKALKLRIKGILDEIETEK